MDSSNSIIIIENKEYKSKNMDYLKLFEGHSDYSSYIADNGITRPSIGFCLDENEVHFNGFDGSEQYLTFVAEEAGTFTLTIGSAVTNGAVTSVSYSLDDGETWTTVNISPTVNNVPITTPTVSAGGTVLWKGNAIRYATSSASTNNVNSSSFSSSGNYSVKGNVMSLLFEDDFSDKTSLSNKDYAFAFLFSGSTKLVSAENLILPATTLAPYCYQAMFRSCDSLISTPKLLATSLVNRCYYYMFHHCSSLTVAPELPATTLAEGCYYAMFRECSSLVTAPELPATTLGIACYRAMFSGCTSLTIAPELPATALTASAYTTMFADCTSLATAQTILPATTLQDTCYYSMFKGCSSLVTAPELPATTLIYQCYRCMFSGCTSLNYVKAMFITDPCNGNSLIGAEGDDDWWLYDVSSTGTFVKNSSATWDNECVIPDGWTVQTASS